MCTNVILLFLLAKALTNSREIALVTALLGSYHIRLEGLYLNGGAIYDVVCYTFFAGAFLAYIKARHRRDQIGGIGLCIFFLLFILALNSKEMAVSLPLVLIAYEFIWNWPNVRNWRELRKNIRSITPLLFCVLITLGAVWMKTGPASPFAGNEAYTPHINLQQYLFTTTRFMEELFWLGDGTVPVKAAVLLLVAMWAFALLTRNRVLLIAAVIVTVCPLPVDFISYRGFFVAYIPLIGWSLYIATILHSARRWFSARLPLNESAASYLLMQLLLPATMIGLILSAQHYDRRRRAYPTLADQRQIRELKDGLARCDLKGRQAVFLLHDAFDPDGWDVLYIARLQYRDVDLQIYRAKKNEVPPLKSGEMLILDYVDNSYREVFSGKSQ